MPDRAGAPSSASRQADRRQDPFARRNDRRDVAVVVGDQLVVGADERGTGVVVQDGDSEVTITAVPRKKPLAVTVS